MIYRTTFFRSIPLALVLSLLPLVSQGASRYEIIATFDSSNHRISGAELIFFDNPSEDPLTEVHMFLYPNIYFEKDTYENENLVLKAYPKAFNPGQITLASVQDSEGNDLTYLYEKSFAMVRIFLKQPILAGERGRLRIFFTTLIPEKFGPFGYFREVTYLQGGWHPYLAPLTANGWDTGGPLPKSDFEILFTVEKDLSILSSGPSRITEEYAGEKVLILEGKDIPFYSLVLHRGYETREVAREHVTLAYHSTAGKSQYADRVMKISDEVVDYFIQRYGRVTLQKIQMAEVHLYKNLVVSGEGILFLSSRLFKIFPSLRRYHEASLAKGILFLLWKEKLFWEDDWVAEGLADRDLQTYLLIKYEGKTNLKRTLNTVAFFPIIDQILYSKKFPLREVYFSETAVPAFNEDIRFLWVPRPTGRAIFTKLNNLLGQKTLDRIVDDYLLKLSQGSRPFLVEISQELSQKDLQSFFAQWLRSNPVIDFSLEKVHRTADNGSYQTTIEITKKGDGVEPLTIHVREENGNEMTLIWDGKGERHQETFITPVPIKVIELDPLGVVNDFDRLNNRDPYRWKILLNRLGANYDFQSNQVSYHFELAFKRVYDLRNQITTEIYQDEKTAGGKLSATHVYRNKQGVTASVSAERPKVPTLTDKTSGIFGLAYQFSYPEVPLEVAYLQQLAGTVPPISFTASYSQRFTGGNYDYMLRLNMDLRKVFSFSNYHAIAARAFFGQSAGDLFKGNRYFLGGNSGLRGYTPLAFGGDNIALYTAEYRVPLLYETDVNLAGLALFHTIQGALFTDTGMVSDDHNTFQFKNYLVNVGASIRLYFDILGFYPTILRLDVAYPIDSPIEGENKPHYYISAGQPI